MLRAVNFKEIIITLLGLATPFILLFGIYYALDRDLAILMSDITENLTAAAPDYKYPNLTIIVCIWAGLILVVSTGYLISLISSKKIKSRKAFNLLLTLLFFSLGLFFILRSVSTEMIWVSGIPASYVLTHYFVFAKKKLISEIAFSFFFLLIVLLQILHFI